MRWASHGVQILVACFGLSTIAYGSVTLTFIPNVPGAVYSSAPFGVSDDGNVVAGTTTFATNNPQQGWVWTRTGGTVLLGQYPYGSGAIGISGDGSTIVGYEAATPVTTRAVQWDRSSGVVTPLSEPSIGTGASAASHNGSVVVGEVGEGDNDVATRWANGSSMVMTENGQSIAISADGSVVVGRFVPDVIQAFRWTAATGAVGLGFLPGGNTSDARGISTDGSVVVGGANTAASGPFLEAFRWTAAGGMQSLGHIGGGTTFATACTADGSIVVGEANAQETAFIWDATHGMRTLADALEQDYGFDSSQYLLEGALGISPDGRFIVGYGSGDNFTGAWIINLPEPGSSAVLSAALGCLILRGSRAGRSSTGRYTASCERAVMGRIRLSIPGWVALGSFVATFAARQVLSPSFGWKLAVLWAIPVLGVVAGFTGICTSRARSPVAWIGAFLNFVLLALIYAITHMPG